MTSKAFARCLLAASVLLIAAGILPAIAQSSAPPDVPALAPDATMLLGWLGFSQYAAGIASLVAAGGYVVVHLVPWLPVPAPGGSRVWAAFYGLLNWIAGNYGAALNASARTISTFIAGLLLSVSLVACAPGQQLSGARTLEVTQTAIDDGHLFCSDIQTPAGQAAVGAVRAIANLAGAPVSVIDQGAGIVGGTCALIGMFPVSPPPAGTVVPIVPVATALPPATS